MIEEFLDWLSDNAGQATVVACIALVIAGGLFFGIRGITNSVNDTSLVTIDDKCVTTKGLIRADAPWTCYVDGKQRVVLPQGAVVSFPATPKTESKTEAPKASALVYDPPCGPGSNANVCTEVITEKSQVKGRIYKVSWHGGTTADSDMDEDHITPDYTEVEYDPCDGGDCENDKVHFCGNVMDQFNPGKMMNMIVKDSKLTEYNGCYMITVTELTDGGKPIHRVSHAAKVPGSY